VSPCDERRLFEAIARQREIVKNSRNKTLRAGRQAQQRLEESPVFAPLAKQQAEANPEPDNPVDPFPFEIWHE